MTNEVNKNDNVHSPSHYQLDGFVGIEVRDVIQSILGDDAFYYYMGNVVKYVLRYNKKNGLEDLKKANVYLNWAIETAEANENSVDYFNKNYHFQETYL